MAVTTEINMAIDEHYKQTGRKPTRIYAGRNQMRDLLLWATSCVYDVYGTTEGYKRPEYHGCKVYEVNDDDHLGIA